MGEVAIRFLFGGMDKIGKFDRILDKEHRNIVADDIPVALLRVELNREAADVARQIGRPFVSCDRRETHKGWSLLARPLEKIRGGDLGKRFVIFKIAVSPKACLLYTSRCV